jgi:DNA-binding GntR family transcriptional regulator
VSGPSNAPKVPAITSELRESITSGEYRPGHQLPSARVLAEHFGVARGTVNTAMALLIREGLVVSRPRAGWFVAQATNVTEVRRTRLASPVSTPRTIERVSVRSATQRDADQLSTRLGAAVFEIRRVVTGPDGTLTSEETTLLTAIDHELVYELPAEQ